MQFIRPTRLLAALFSFALASLVAPEAMAERTQAANVVPVFSFTFPGADFTTAPRGVRGDLLLASDNNVYFGSTSGGTGAGAIAKLTPDGTVQTIYSLKDDGTEGVSIYGGLIQGSDGALYGTSFFGGNEGGGTLFRVTLDGTFKVLHEFGGGEPNPIFPYTGVVQGPDGFLYGTTLNGGSRNFGVVYRIAIDGTQFSIIHEFRGGNGKSPEGKLAVLGGLLYGTTLLGGDDDRGVLYRISPSGNFEQLYSFPRLGAFNSQGLAVNATGSNPRAGMIVGIDGNLYGTAYQGGVNGHGTLFRLTPAGQVSVVHAFSGPINGSRKPLSGVVQDAAGNFYGTTEEGGYRVAGSAYKVAPDGTHTLLHGFQGSAVDGLAPYSGLLLAHGTIYGVSVQDSGDGGSGMLFKLETGTGGTPPVDLQISSSNVALGTGVTLTWAATAGWTCTKVQGLTGWSGETTTSGTQTITPNPGTYTFGLTCLEPDDGVEATPRVVRAAYAGLNVEAPLLNPVDGGGGVGSLSLWWLLLVAALLVFKVNKESRVPCP